MGEPITIVGGGLAGLTLGIGLRQRGVPVTVWEAGKYPRHRVCGEFISGRGQASLERLGLLRTVEHGGAIRANSVRFFAGATGHAPRLLPEPALCLSRFVLDELLASEFQQLGGMLKTNDRWRGDFGPGIVRATGRRVEAVADGWRLFGLKVHARNIALTADLEMHLLPAGYVGVCRLPAGESNICGLFRSRTPVPDLQAQWREWLSGPVDSALRARLADAAFDVSSFVSVAGLDLHVRHSVEFVECSVGDSLTMIPPVTGNGMSMAFESAELAIEPLEKFSNGRCTWEQARAAIADQCDRQFRRRLVWAARFQSLLFRPTCRDLLLGLTARSEKLWQFAFELTR